VALRAPTVEKVQATVAQLEENPRTSLADRALKLLFDAHPKNTEVPLVLQKVATLNALYSPQIYDVIRVAQHIVALGIDSSIASGSLGIVPKIAAVKIQGRSGFLEANCQIPRQDPYRHPFEYQYAVSHIARSSIATSPVLPTSGPPSRQREDPACAGLVKGRVVLTIERCASVRVGTTCRS